jgi:hypothetical protein
MLDPKEFSSEAGFAVGEGASKFELNPSIQQGNLVISS